MSHCALRPQFGTALPSESGPLCSLRCPTAGTSVAFPGPACTVSGGLAIAPQAVSLAHENHQTWLRDSVRPASSQVQGRSVHLCVEQGCPSLACGRSRSPAGEGRDRAGPSSRDEVRVLQPVTSSYPRKAVGVRPILDLRVLNRALPTPVQDVDAETHFSMHRPFDWVRKRFDLKDAYFMSQSSLDTDRSFSALRSKDEHISTKSSPSGYPCRLVSFTKVVEAALVPLRESRHSHSQLPRRLLILAQSRALLCEHRDNGAWPPQPVGASGQLGKEQTLPCAEDSLSRHGVGLRSTSQHVSQWSVPQSMLNCLESSSARGAVPLKHFQRLLGHMAIHSRCHAARIASYETASALASRPGPEMGMATRQVPGSQLPPSCRQTFGPWSDLAFSSGRSSPRASIQACCCVNRCLCHGLGSHVQRACSCRARVASSMACSAPLQRAATRQASYWSVRTTLRPLRTSTTRVVYAPSPVATRPPSSLLLESEASEVASRRSYPGELNRAADELSRQPALQGEW